MRKVSRYKMLRRMSMGATHLFYRTSAFSLAELVVSLGILVVMFALAGQVFNFTIQSTGQATAIVEVNQQLRALEQTLRDDLTNVERGQSMILIQGNPVNAYWTRNGKDADNDPNPQTPPFNKISDPEREFLLNGEPAPIPPRADLLMFFTSRKASSYTDSAVTANVQQVVYGHAELGEYVPVSSGSGVIERFRFQGIVATQGAQVDAPLFPVGPDGYPSPTDVCPMPASEWHLARRSVLIAPAYSPRLNPPGENIIDFPVARLDDVRLLEGATDIIASFSAPGGTGIEPFDYEREALLPFQQLLDLWQRPIIFDRMTPHARSRLDVTPPPAYANRLGHYLLPNCASFKVEWTLDPQSSFVAGRLDGMTEILWFDPGFVKNPFSPNPAQDDPLQTLEDAIQKAVARGDRQRELNLDSLLNKPTEHTDGTNYTLSERFRSDLFSGNVNGFAPIGSDGRANTIAFVGNRFNAATGEYVPDDIFPSALRITVDVFDREGRLDRPVRHVMVIPVGR